MVHDVGHPVFLADGRETGRWGKAFAGVLALHMAIVAGAVYWRAEVPLPPAPSETSIALDLVPLPVADEIAAEKPAAMPEKVDVPPPMPVERTVPPEPVQPIIEPEVPLPVLAPPAPAPVRPTVAAAVPDSGAADSGLASGASASTASATGGRAGPAGERRGGDAAAAWRGRVLAHLDRHKRYPPVAKKMKRQGRVRVDMTLDRQGRVLAVSVGKGAGFKALDEEAVETVRRAQPLPVPPPEIGGETIPMQVPIGFSLGGV